MEPPIYPNVVHGALDVTGRKVRYQDAGKAVDHRLPVVMIHGTGGTVATHFHTLFPMLASRGRTIGIDLDSGGASDENLSLDDLVTQVEAVTDHVLGGSEYCVVGYSLGACVAAVVAANNATTAAQLVLLNGWATTDNAMRLRFELWQRLFDDEKTHPALAELMLLNVYGRNFLNLIPYVGPRPYTQVTAMRDEYVIGPGSARQVELNRTLDISDAILNVSSQTLVIGSASDQLVPIDHSYELFGAIENSALAVIPGGHGSVTERPAHVFQLVDRFLREPAAFPAGVVVSDDLVTQLDTINLEEFA